MANIDLDALQKYLNDADKRKAELDALAAGVKITPNAGKTPAVGEKVSQSEVDTYMANKPIKASGESNSSYNARVTQWYKDQPYSGLTPAQEAAGATLRWVRTGAAGEGEYKVVYPIGVQFDKNTGEPIAKNTSTAPKVVDHTVKNADGTSTVYYTDGTSQTLLPVGGSGGTSTGDATADLIAKQNQAAIDAAKLQERQSAYDLLYNEFNKYGLGTLVEGIKDLIKSNVSPSQFSIALQNTDAYKQRFAANQDRIKAGLRALTPAEYIGLEDQYQNIMRNYGLPSSYWSKDSMGTQAGFNKFIANDVSAAELEDRIATAQKRVLNADVNVTNALKQFYPDITNADILAYTLDPTNALENIKRKVTAAEIGGAALGQGLGTSVGRAEELAKYGVTKAQAQQGYSTIGEFLPTAEKLGDIYAKQGLGDYNQAVAESEIFNTANAADAARKRKKLTQLEQATFGGQAGTSQGALARDRAGSI